MKRVFTAILALAMCLTFSACLLSTETVYHEDGSYSYGDSNSFFIPEIPFEIDCNGLQIALSSLSYYEVPAEHGYNGYIILSIDRSNLTNDDIYWITTRIDHSDKELRANAYLTNEENGLESEHISLLDSRYNQDYIHYIYRTELMRYALSSGKITAQIYISPEHSITADSTRCYYYDLELSPDVDYQDLSRLETHEAHAVSLAIVEAARGQ